MEGEQAPAAAPATTGTEATPTTNSNPAPAEAPASAPAQNTPATEPSTPADPNAWLKDAPEEFRRFVEGNGGYEKAFGKMKQTISAPQQPAPQAPAENNVPAQQVPAQQASINQTIPGSISQQEMVTTMYFDSVANRPEYANIANEIRSGEIFNQMKALGTSPFEMDGSLNQARLDAFLGMYSKTKPAITPSTPEVSNTPTVNYTQVNEGGITSRAEAFKIMQEAGNPNHAAAVEWLKKDYQNILSGKAK